MIQQDLIKKIRLVCSDIDGTVLNSQGRMSERTKKAIRELTQNNIPFVLVSARPPKGIQCFYDDLNLSACVCAYSGGYLSEAGKVLINHVLPLEPSLEICREAQQRKIHASVYQMEHWYVQCLDAAAKWEADAIGFLPEQVSYDQLFEQFRTTGQAPNKILCIGEPSAVSEYQTVLKEKYGNLLDCCLSKDTYLEVMPKNVTKVAAIQALCDLKGIDRKQTMAFGDHYNDLAMLAYAGIGVAVENAPDEVKAAADFVSCSNDQDGVAVVLEQLIAANQ